MRIKKTITSLMIFAVAIGAGAGSAVAGGYRAEQTEKGDICDCDVDVAASPYHYVNEEKLRGAPNVVIQTETAYSYGYDGDAYGGGHDIGVRVHYGQKQFVRRAADTPARAVRARATSHGASRREKHSRPISRDYDHERADASARESIEQNETANLNCLQLTADPYGSYER